MDTADDISLQHACSFSNTLFFARSTQIKQRALKSNLQQLFDLLIISITSLHFFSECLDTLQFGEILSTGHAHTESSDSLQHCLIL